MAQLNISDKAALAKALREDASSSHAVLTHINADTTWLLHLPYPKGTTPPSGRRRLNVLLDPWLSGPQSDGGSWFSVQWHVVPPSVSSIGELNMLLREVERGVEKNEEEEEESFIDVVVISHEFTDHCHEATLRELPSSTPVLAPDKALRLIQSWKHFDTVLEMPGFSFTTQDWRQVLRPPPFLPPWLGIARVVTPGNALYYHSAVMVVWDTATGTEKNSLINSSNGDAIIYSPHGIHADDLIGIKATGIRTLALLHGLDDIRIWMTKQLNLGAVNGVAAARISGAKYWVATHDEVKKGAGLIAPLLRRTRWSVVDAVRKAGQRKGTGEEQGQVPGYEFVELGSGDGLVLA